MIQLYFVKKPCWKSPIETIRFNLKEQFTIGHRNIEDCIPLFKIIVKKNELSMSSFLNFQRGWSLKWAKIVPS